MFAKVHKVIQRVPELSYMKARARINSAGEWLCAEDLSFPGQTFTGTVVENYIEGIFEIQPVRYYGENSPGLPFDYPLEDSLNKYIEPELFIESNDPILIKKAKEISKHFSSMMLKMNHIKMEDILDSPAYLQYIPAYKITYNNICSLKS